jgi:hypothetical protein
VYRPASIYFLVPQVFGLLAELLDQKT